MAHSDRDTKPRLLAVDDSADSGELIVRIAVSSGYEAECVTDAQLVAEMAKISKPDVITLDLGMPGLDGVDIILRLEEIRFKGAIIIVSGLSRLQREQAVNIARSRGLNVLDHLPKPVQLQALRGLLAMAQDTRQVGGLQRRYYS
jgi:CheY-like chemotaxis protein